MSQSLATFLAKGVVAIYGLLALVVTILYSLSRPDTWKQETDNERQEFEKACNDLWSLSKTNDELFHGFLTLENGLQLHYLSSKPPSKVSSNNLIIFLHGFPDTCYVWEKQLRSNLASKAMLVALDLPGCGGSDNLSFYGPDQMLNAVAEAVLKLKARYPVATSASNAMQNPVLVSHDWGGAIACRLAGETSGLVDEVVVMNSSYPLAASDQVVKLLGQSRDAICAGEIKGAWSKLKPVFSQLLLSNYIFMLNLRLPLAKWMPWLSASLVKLCHEAALKGTPHASSHRAHTKSLATSYGPSPSDCKSRAPAGEIYGPTVLHRAKQNPQGDWDERVRIYSEGLALGEWNPTYPGYQAPLWASDPENRRKGRFSYPVHVVFGMDDLALDPRIVLDGIDDFMLEAEDGLRKPEKGSEADVVVQRIGRSSVIKLSMSGHWAMLDVQGSRVLDEVLRRAVSDGE